MKFGGDTNLGFIFAVGVLWRKTERRSSFLFLYSVSRFFYCCVFRVGWEEISFTLTPPPHSRHPKAMDGKREKRYSLFSILPQRKDFFNWWSSGARTWVLKIRRPRNLETPQNSVTEEGGSKGHQRPDFRCGKAPNPPSARPNFCRFLNSPAVKVSLPYKKHTCF